MAEPTEVPLRRPRRLRLLLAAPLVLGLAGVAFVALRPDSEPAVSAPTTTASTTTSTTVAPPTPEVPEVTPLASPKGAVPTFDGPDGEAIGQVGFWYGYPMTMPIVEEQGDWMRIMLPERPNGSTAWVRAADVVTSSSPYRIVISLGQTNLTVYEDGFPLFTVPVGIGKDSTPTPKGSFFVAVIGAPAPANYGPVVLDTSSHSEAIESWQGSGDAITSIHGQLSESSAAQIGTTGARISNGCIRMLAADQLKMDIITVGTPVDFVD